jgi:hypothetical protein
MAPFGPDVLAQACNPSYLEGLQFKASIGKKFTRPHLNQELGMVVTPVILARGEAQIRGS